MTLPNAILFPQAMLPLFIFERRYRSMLHDVLEGNRLFAIALQKSGRVRETPYQIAGLGLVRASVRNRNGTSNLILQGITRVEIGPRVRTKPYRVHKIRPINSVGAKSLITEKLMVQLLDIAAERLKQGFHFPIHLVKPAKATVSSPGHTHMVESILQSIRYLSKLNDPEQLGDLISCTLLTSAVERQVILETADVEVRLKNLMHFLMAEIERNKDGRSNEDE